MRAIITDPSRPHGLGLGEVNDPLVLPGDVVVRVEAISLNQGEVRFALDTAEPGWTPGWDFAGVVERAAESGGPVVGDRVVGFQTEGAWRERIATPARNLAVLPDDVPLSVASTLPVAGLTALYALAEGGLLAGREVLINGASGGVGHMAVQLAAASGARVTAAVRRPNQVDGATDDGAHEVLVSEALAELEEDQRFDLILESAGGAALGHALNRLAAGGACVSFGNSSRSPTTFDATPFFYPRGGSRLLGFYLLAVLERDAPSIGLARLARLVSEGVLRPRIAVEAPWTDIGDVVDRFMRREIGGKAVLHVA